MTLALQRGFLISMVFALSLLQGCATSVKATSMQNPPPSEAFSGFGRIRVQPVVFRPGYDGDKSGLVKINQNIQEDLASSLANWNMRPDNGRVLIIEPVIEEMEFKHGVKRVMLGPLAGSSGVLMRMKITDGNGKVVALPEFFQRANAMAAGFVFGVHDNLMLTRVANLASRYIMDNYSSAIGGQTGADEKALAR
ncbi:hypothetical protein ACO0K9_15250 [Undibacterium sp. Ji50W]|uniref:hypothetical protein n=1 Tax=Undibacterium sp. Ji50W TaxID=3413041 RepID=UPI003BF1C699